MRTRVADNIHNATTHSRPNARRKRPLIVEKVEAVYSVYPNRMQTREALRSLKRAGFRATDISASSLKSKTVTDLRKKPLRPSDAYAAAEGVLDATSRFVGCVLGISSVAIAAPIALAAPIFRAAGAGVMRALGAGTPAKASQDEVEHEMLIKVDCESRREAERAAKILGSTGGQDVGLSGEYAFEHDRRFAA